MWDRDGTEMDLVTHDLRKFVRLMLKPNGYVLEQLLSPLVVHTSGPHMELVALAPAVLTRDHARHYGGFARNQWRLHEKSSELKPLLYTFRALLTGIHLMRSGEVRAHMPSLLDDVEAPAYLPELIEAKAEAEHGRAQGLDGGLVARDVEALHGVLEEAREASALPGTAGGFDALNELVVRVRSGQPG